MAGDPHEEELSIDRIGFFSATWTSRLFRLGMVREQLAVPCSVSLLVATAVLYEAVSTG